MYQKEAWKEYEDIKQLILGGLIKFYGVQVDVIDNIKKKVFGLFRT